MTMLVVTACMAFALGFLIGERRAVLQANEILDTNMKELFRAIGDEPARPDDDAGPARETVH